MLKLVPLTLCAASIVVAGCSNKSPDANQKDGRSNSAAGIDGAKFRLDGEPEGAAGVVAVRKNAEDGGDVVVVGRIGGSKNPWVSDRAAFTIVDPSLKSCAEIGSDNCPKPWDFC